MTDSNLDSPKLLGAAYILYPSIRQDDLFSLEAQLGEVKARSAADGIEIVKIYSDQANSGSNHKYRPGVAEMLADSKKGLFNVLYFSRIDHLARRLEWAIGIVKQIQKESVTFKKLEQRFDLDELTYSPQCVSTHCVSRFKVSSHD